MFCCGYNGSYVVELTVDDISTFSLVYGLLHLFKPVNMFSCCRKQCGISRTSIRDKCALFIVHSESQFDLYCNVFKRISCKLSPNLNQENGLLRE